MRCAIAAAWRAQEDFEEACRQRGREVLDQLSPQRRAVVVVSQPYNGCDQGINLDLPGKLRKHPDDPFQFARDDGSWFLHLGDTGYRYVVASEQYRCLWRL